MHDNNDFNDQTLGAFIDGQLDTEICESIIKAMDSDINIKNKIHNLRRSKDLMKLGFSNLKSTPGRNIIKRKQWKQTRISIAASFAAIAIFLSSGFFAYYFAVQKQITELSLESTSLQHKSQRILLHISESNIQHFSAAMNYIDNFLKEHRNKHDEIAVIANAGGLDIMRVGFSPYEKKILNLINSHANIHFIACANSVGSLRQKDINFNLIQQVRINKPAMDHIIEYIQNGWTYKKVNTLIKI